ncbi:hypothetical protein COB57_04540, partial [Candidatus Peregrinibacteria bacterium]
MNIKLLNIHLSDLPEEKERFDTLISPSGTVATLNKIASNLGIEHMGYDGAFPNSEEVAQAIKNDIRNTLESGSSPVLLFTTLVYNAQSTLAFITEIKQEFTHSVKIIVGGQLIPFAKKAYIQNLNIDAVCIGDGEALIPELMNDIKQGTLKRHYEKWLSSSPETTGKFEMVDYSNFYQLDERMLAQKALSGLSQLCLQGLGGPGCSWAANNKNKACDFCSLQNITEMNRQSLDTVMQTQKYLQDTLNPDRFFDVANQFLPFLSVKENIEWLKKYINKREEYNINTPKYVYLTVISVTDKIATLLKQAGVEEVYLGVDHFDKTALTELNKS